MAELVGVARRHGLPVHLDGARLANAVAALGGTRAALRSFTVDAGVDAVSFGGTKNGLMAAEAVVVLNPDVVTGVGYLRKTSMQLASKMRFVSAQLLAYIDDGLWLELAGNANRQAARKAAATGKRVGKDAAARALATSGPDARPELALKLRARVFPWLVNDLAFSIAATRGALRITSPAV